MKKDMTAKLKNLNPGPRAAESSVGSTFRGAANPLDKRSTRKWTQNMDEDVYQALRKKAFEEETDMSSLVNQFLREALLDN